MVYTLTVMANRQSCMTQLTTKELSYVRRQLDDFADMLHIARFGTRITQKKLNELIQTGQLEIEAGGVRVMIGFH